MPSWCFICSANSTAWPPLESSVKTNRAPVVLICSRVPSKSAWFVSATAKARSESDGHLRLLYTPFSKLRQPKVSGRSPRFPRKISSSCQIYRFHKSLQATIFKDRRLRVEREGNAELSSTAPFCRIPLERFDQAPPYSPDLKISFSTA